MVSTFRDCVDYSSSIMKRPQPIAEAVLWTRLAMLFSTSDIMSRDAGRLALTTYDEKNGWVDPYGFKTLPSAIRFQTQIATIESLGQKADLGHQR
jgi:hypothetical protein